MKKNRRSIMDCRGRRSRRGRAHSPCDVAPPCPKPCGFLNAFCNFLILSSLIGVIYLVLDYHCNNCSSKCDLNSINKSIEDIAKNLAVMKNNYYDLELKISQFSHELPKIEGQMDIIESLAHAIENKDGWDPRSSIPLPNVDVFLNKQAQELGGRNVTQKATCQCPNRLL